MINLDKYKEYLLARGLSNNYYNAMRIFLVYLGERELTQEIITQFFNENEYSEQSKNLYIKAGRNYQIYLGNMESEWSKIKLLKCPRKIPNYLSEKELGQAIAYMITYHSKIITSIKAEALLHFMFYSGVRKAELLGLKRVDFDLEEGIVKVYGKGKKERLVYYPKKVAEQLRAYFQSEVEQINAFGMSLYSINYLISLLKKHFSTKNITCHLFRHSGARYMIDKGLPIGTVSRILGHSSINTTIIYTDPNEETIRRQYQEKMK